jgi:hypothetical protein
LITPLNSVFLSLDKALNDEILLEGGLKLYLDGNFNPEWNATVTGKVAGIPKHPTGLCAEVCSKIKVGDEIAFSYRVVSDRCFNKVNDYFMQTKSGNPYQEKFTNFKKDILTITTMPPAFNKFSKIWIGLLTDKNGKWIDGTQGNESEIERWKSQFNFSGVQDLGFNNLLFADKQNLWRCQFTEILARKVGDKIIAINDRVICEKIEEDVKHKIELQEGIALPFHDVKMRYIDRGKMVSGGEDMGFKKGDILSFEPQYCEKYDLWGKKYMLIKKRRVQGIWSLG